MQPIFAKRWLSRLAPTSILSPSTSSSSIPPSALPSPVPTDIIHTRPSPGKGLGLFATRPIPAGTSILIDAPILALEAGQDLPDLYALFKTLTPAHQATFLSLSPVHDTARDVTLARKLADRGHTPADVNAMRNIAAVFQGNAFNVTDASAHGGLRRVCCAQLARANHSCSPSAHACFYPSTTGGAMVVHAVRDVRQGEEVTVAYFSTVMAVAERRRRAGAWGFVCACAVCEGPEAEVWEAKRARMRALEARREMVGELGGVASVEALRAAVEDAREMVAMTEEREDGGLMVLAPTAWDAVGEALALLLRKTGEVGGLGEAETAFEMAAEAEAGISGCGSVESRKRREKARLFSMEVFEVARRKR